MAGCLSVWDLINSLDRLNGDAHTHYINQRLRRQQRPNPAGNIEESWIFGLCMKCRVEDNTPSWEPKYWQKLFPYPLCPSYRQVANFLAIFLIGELKRLQGDNNRRFKKLET